MKYLVKIYVFWAPFQHCNLLNMTKFFYVVILPKCIWVKSIPGGENGEENSRVHPQMIPCHDTQVSQNSCTLYKLKYSLRSVVHANTQLNIVLYFPSETTVSCCCIMFVQKLYNPVKSWLLYCNTQLVNCLLGSHRCCEAYFDYSFQRSLKVTG